MKPYLYFHMGVIYIDTFYKYKNGKILEVAVQVDDSMADYDNFGALGKHR